MKIKVNECICAVSRRTSIAEIDRAFLIHFALLPWPSGANELDNSLAVCFYATLALQPATLNCRLHRFPLGTLYSNIIQWPLTVEFV